MPCSCTAGWTSGQRAFLCACVLTRVRTSREGCDCGCCLLAAWRPPPPPKQGFYQLLLTESPNATVIYEDMLLRRVVCPPFVRAQANTRSFPRLDTVPGANDAEIRGRMCYASNATLAPSCEEQHVLFADFAGYVAVSTAQLGGGGNGGYDLLFRNLQYVCQHQVGAAHAHTRCASARASARACTPRRRQQSVQRGRHARAGEGPASVAFCK